MVMVVFDVPPTPSSFRPGAFPLTADRKSRRLCRRGEGFGVAVQRGVLRRAGDLRDEPWLPEVAGSCTDQTPPEKPYKVKYSVCPLVGRLLKLAVSPRVPA